MRKIKTVTEVTCDCCGHHLRQDDGGAVLELVGEDWDLCGICANKFKDVWSFLTITVGLDAAWKKIEVRE